MKIFPAKTYAPSRSSSRGTILNNIRVISCFAGFTVSVSLFAQAPTERASTPDPPVSETPRRTVLDMVGAATALDTAGSAVARYRSAQGSGDALEAQEVPMALLLIAAAVIWLIVIIVASRSKGLVWIAIIGIVLLLAIGAAAVVKGACLRR
jgi:hypothetical protein